MFAVLSICVLLAAQAFTASAMCDMKNRFPGTCTANQCCAMTSIPNVGIFCKPLPVAGEKCATRDTPFICPCAPGLTCKPRIKPNGIKSMYGKCV